MPKITITKENTAQDFGGGKVNPVVPDGVYSATVSSARFETDDQKRDKIIVDFRADDNQGEASGQLFRKWNYMHQEETKRISIENLENIGVPDWWNYKNLKELNGKKCRIQVQQSVNSHDNSEIKSILQRYVPAGEYQTKIVKVGDIEQPKTGAGTHPFIRVFYKVMEGQMAGLKIMDRLYLNANALGVTAAKLGSIGIQAGDFDTDSQRDRQSLVGLWVKLTYVEQRQSDGKVSGRINKFEKLGRNPAPSALSNGASTATAPATTTQNVTTPKAATVSTPAAKPAGALTVDMPVSAVAGAAVAEDVSDEDDIPFSNP